MADEKVDPYNNSIIDNAKSALTPEQLEDYKKIGEYMYNNDVYKIAETRTSNKNASDTQLCLYATEALKAGGDPKDLTDLELRALEKYYGQKWYEKFDLDISEIVKPILGFNQDKPLSRQQKRLIEKKAKKAEKSQSKK
jgi:hypothetical protein